MPFEVFGEEPWSPCADHAGASRLAADDRGLAGDIRRKCWRRGSVPRSSARGAGVFVGTTAEMQSLEPPRLGVDVAAKGVL